MSVLMDRKDLAMHEVLDGAELDTATLNEVPVAAAILDRHGVVSWTNETWTRFGRDNGLERPPGTGTDYLALCRAAGEHALAEALSSLLAGRTRSHIHDYPYRSPGERRWFRLIAKAARGTRGTAAVLYHVTPNADFRAQVRDLQASELAGRVTCSLVHDFNNLLTAILGHAASLEASRRYSREDVQSIMRAAQHAGSLTRRILTYSRLGATNAQSLPLRSWLLELEPLLRSLTGPRIAVTLSLPAVSRYVSIDPIELEQVVLNLVINARDAMPRGGPLTVRVDNLGGRVGLHVEDRGEGIPPDVLGRIFEPFFTTKAREVGTGLGLSSVLDSVKRAGGEVEVRSELGVGSTFSVWLPEASRPVSSSTPPSTASAGGTETILFVEDDYRVRVPTSRALRELGYQVIVAPSAEEALCLPPEQLLHVQLLLTDVQMPGMTGTALAHELCQRIPSLRVLYISGYSESGIEAGDGHTPNYLAKPFAPDELGRKVREVLDGTG